MIELVVFDMAGTTIDEDNVVYKTVRAAINAAGYAVSQDQVQAAGAGKEKSQAIRDVLALDGNAHDDEEIAAIFADFKARLSEAYADLEVRPQRGAEDVFARLRSEGIRVVLNTGYDRPTAEKLLRKLGWVSGQAIDDLVTASDVPRNRPAPDMILEAMRRTNVTQSSKVAKVGDSAIDIEEGQNAGCLVTLGITTGAQTAQQLRAARPTAVIDRLGDVFRFFEPVG